MPPGILWVLPGRGGTGLRTRKSRAPRSDVNSFVSLSSVLPTPASSTGTASPPLKKPRPPKRVKPVEETPASGTRPRVDTGSVSSAGSRPPGRSSGTGYRSDRSERRHFPSRQTRSDRRGSRGSATSPAQSGRGTATPEGVHRYHSLFPGGGTVPVLVSSGSSSDTGRYFLCWS